MSVVLQISDTHFGTEQAPVAQALLRLAHAQAPDLVVLSGDITQRARRYQFQRARQFLEQLAAPAQLILPGNHDIPLFNLPARLLAPYRNHRREFGDELEPCFESAELLVIGVKTTRRVRHIDGTISAAQIERVARQLRLAAPGQLRMVVAHHPLHVTRPEDENNLLHGAAAAVRAWAEAGADLVLGGHIHLPFVRSLRERYADLPRDLWAVQAGTAISWRVRREAPNSINVIRYEGAEATRRCVVERWDYGVQEQNFVLAQHMLIDLD